MAFNLDSFVRAMAKLGWIQFGTCHGYFPQVPQFNGFEVMTIAPVSMPGWEFRFKRALKSV